MRAVGRQAARTGYPVGVEALQSSIAALHWCSPNIPK